VVAVSPGSYCLFDSVGTVQPQVDLILPTIKRAGPVLVKLNWQVLPFSPGLISPKLWIVFSKEIAGDSLLVPETSFGEVSCECARLLIGRQRIIPAKPNIKAK